LYREYIEECWFNERCASNFWSRKNKRILLKQTAWIFPSLAWLNIKIDRINSFRNMKGRMAVRQCTMNKPCLRCKTWAPNSNLPTLNLLQALTVHLGRTLWFPA
jgi:hypothetical protein